MAVNMSVDAIVLDVQFQNQALVSATLDDAKSEVKARQKKIAETQERIKKKEEKLEKKQGEADEIADKPDDLLEVLATAITTALGVDNTEERIEKKEAEVDKISTKIEDLETDIDVERERISEQVEEMTEALESFTSDTNLLEGMARETEQLMAEINRSRV